MSHMSNDAPRRERVTDRAPGQWEVAVLAVLVLIPIAFNAIMLFSELWLPVSTHSDIGWHYTFLQGASAALAHGDNPFDFWLPDFGLGFPQFLYYQHLPHLAVVLLHRLLLKQVDLLTLFNLVRYSLLVGFPLTVYWSMRTMGFSVVGAAVAAACASLLSGQSGYGFEYYSYVWWGRGMYTQLWAMHLFFISMACLQRLLAKGTGYLAAVVACSALVLSHLLYVYMAALTALALFLPSLLPQRAPADQFQMNDRPVPTRLVTPWSLNALQCIARLAIVGALAAVITSYFWLPFLLLKAYFNLDPSVHVEAAIHHSLPLRQVPTGLLNQQLLDHGRLPVFTMMLLIGAAYAGFTRTTAARVALAVSVFWIALYFGLSTWPALTVVLPMHEVLVSGRFFIGGLDLGAILLIGLGGEWLWRRFAALAEPWRAVVPGLIILALMVPALRERYRSYAFNMRRIAMTLGADSDWQEMLSTLRSLPPGRVHSLDKRSFYDIPTIDPGQNLSLNSLLKFDFRNPTYYNIFNVRYVIAPSGLSEPEFLIPIKRTSRFTLYRAETSGFAQFVAASPGSIPSRGMVDAQRVLFERNQEWLRGSDPGAGKFIRWDYPPGRKDGQDKVSPGGPASGTVIEERVSSDRIDLSVDCREAATLVIKITYHPDWHVTIDGMEQATFMLSPSYLGVEVLPSRHEIHAEYRSGMLKKFLLLLGACTLTATIALRRRFAGIEDHPATPGRSST